MFGRLLVGSTKFLTHRPPPILRLIMMGWKLLCFVSSFPGSVLCWGVGGAGPSEEGQAPDRRQKWPLCGPQDWGEQSQLQGALIHIHVNCPQDWGKIPVDDNSEYWFMSNMRLLLVQDKYVDPDVIVNGSGPVRGLQREPGVELRGSFPGRAAQRPLSPTWGCSWFTSQSAS